MSVIAGLRSGYVLIVALLIGGGLTLGLVFLVNRSGALSTPEAVVQQYMVRIYAQDYNLAYELISTADQAYKSREEYLRENSSFTGFTLEAARQLASYIEYPEIQIEKQGDNRATVTVKFVVPDGNAEVVRDILFAAPREGNELPQAERNTLLEKLDRLHANGQIPTFEGEQTFALVKEQDGWRILENWAEAVRVHFNGEVKAGLPWEFEPVQAVVLAQPGETLQTAYRVKNLSDQPVTAKARHTDKPEEYVDFLEIIQCFCFIQQTLQPGEELELPLVFRVEWDVPPEVKDFYVHYEFYPLESFPEK
jgi:hypothetical protein